MTLSDLFAPVSETSSAECGGAGSPTTYQAFGGKVVFAVFNGVISVANADNLSPSLHAILNKDVEQVILSLKNVTKLSHTAVGILVDFASGVIGRGKSLYLYEPAPYIEQRLVNLNVARFFRILRDENELFCILPIEQA